MNNVKYREIEKIEYEQALDLQRDAFDRVMEDKLAGKISESQILIMCEHPHVYTLGKSGHEENLLINSEFLRKIEAKYYKTDRGGDITYHGPGQVVGYPVLDLEAWGLGLREYIWLLEQSVIDTVAEYGITAGRLDGATGVWVTGDSAKKICAIGVKASRYVTMHGFALNVTPDLRYFSYINPCGFTDKGVTSIEQQTGLRPSLQEVANLYKEHFERLLFEKR